MRSRLTEAQHRALTWMIAAPRTADRSWCLNVDPKTHNALARKGFIADASGIVSITDAGRRALAHHTGTGGREP